MSDAQRQAVTELMRSSVRVAERPGPHPPGGGSLQGPRFRGQTGLHQRAVIETFWTHSHAHAQGRMRLHPP
jgi:hypothetical protein